MVSPFDFFLDFVLFVLPLVHGHHLSLLLSQLQLILQHQLGVSLLLQCPHLLFLSLLLVKALFLQDLLLPLVLNLSLLLGSEALEVVWHVSVLTELALSSAGILSHEIAVVGVVNFELILILLLLSPLVLPVALLLGETLVFLL